MKRAIAGWWMTDRHARAAKSCASPQERVAIDAAVKSAGRGCQEIAGFRRL